MSEQRDRMFERMGQELERVRAERDSMAGHLRDLRAVQEQLAGHYERIEAELERVTAERDALAKQLDFAADDVVMGYYVPLVARLEAERDAARQAAGAWKAQLEALVEVALDTTYSASGSFPAWLRPLDSYLANEISDDMWAKANDKLTEKYKLLKGAQDD